MFKRKLKRILRRHPWVKWALPAGVLALGAAVVLVVLLSGVSNQKPPIGN